MMWHFEQAARLDSPGRSSLGEARSMATTPLPPYERNELNEAPVHELRDATPEREAWDVARCRCGSAAWLDESLVPSRRLGIPYPLAAPPFPPGSPHTPIPAPLLH